MPASIPSNFGFLGVQDEQLVRFGIVTELPSARTETGVLLYEPQYDLTRRLTDRGPPAQQVRQFTPAVLRSGNGASSAVVGDHPMALGASI